MILQGEAVLFTTDRDHETNIEQSGKNPRRLTPRECARLQGFPDSFKIPASDTQAYRQFGNSVVVPLMENVATLIVKEIERLDNESSQSRDEMIISEVG